MTMPRKRDTMVGGVHESSLNSGICRRMIEQKLSKAFSTGSIKLV